MGYVICIGIFLTVAFLILAASSALFGWAKLSDEYEIGEAKDEDGNDDFHRDIKFSSADGNKRIVFHEEEED